MIRFHRMRRQPPTPEQTAANAAERARRLRAVMTCQCCARKYLANIGSMAHHGYTRPGFGWQTASCMGAKELPFEVAREALGRLIKALERHLTDLKKSRAAANAERMPIVRSYREGFDRAAKKIEVEFTRVNFKDNSRLLNKCGYYYSTFDELKKAELFGRDRDIKGMTEEIAAQQARFDGWKQTHEWVELAQGGAWVLLADGLAGHHPGQSKAERKSRTGE